MNANLSQNNGKFRISNIKFPELRILEDGYQSYLAQVTILTKTMGKTKDVKDWSMLQKLQYDLQKHTNKRTIQDRYSLAFELHELFVFYEMLQFLQTNKTGYEQAIARHLIFLVHPALPATETTRSLEVYSDL